MNNPVDILIEKHFIELIKGYKIHNLDSNTIAYTNHNGYLFHINKIHYDLFYSTLLFDKHIKILFNITDSLLNNTLLKLFKKYINDKPITIDPCKSDVALDILYRIINAKESPWNS